MFSIKAILHGRRVVTLQLALLALGESLVEEIAVGVLRAGVAAHDAAGDIEASLRVMWHLINEVGVPMFKAARSNASAVALAFWEACAISASTPLRAC